MKIGILTQSPQSFEVKRLVIAAQSLGHEATIINVRDVVIEVGHIDKENGVFYQGENLTQYDMVIVRFIFNAVKRTKAIIRFLRSEGIKVMDNNLSTVGYNIDKILDTVLFYNAGISIPISINAMDEEDFRESCEELGYPVIIKHTGSGKGQGVYKMDDANDLEDFMEKVKADEKAFKTYLIQEYIPYIQDIRVLVIGNKIIGAMQRIPQEGEFRANFSRGGSVKKLDIDDETKEMCLKAALVTQAVNAGVDVLVAQDGKKYILEVNRTPGFEGFEKATEMDIAKIFIEEAINSAT